MGVLRTLWVIIPLALTLISTILILLVYLQQLSSTGLLRELHFLTVSLNSTASVSAAGVSTSLSSILNGAGIESSYDIGLWNYCTPTKCSAPTSGFYFNPLTVWGLDSKQVEGFLPNEWESGLNLYASVSKWMFAAYTAAVVVTGLALLNGIIALCLSRMSACCTALLNFIAAGLSVAASATSTALFLTVKGFLYEKLHTYGVQTDVNNKTLGYTWAASAFAILAAFGWVIGMCCSGKSTKAHKGSDYDRLVHPATPAWHGQQHGQHQHAGNAYGMQNMHQVRTGYEPVSRV